MAMYCPHRECAGEAFDDAEFLCRRHRLDLVPEPPAREEATARSGGRRWCVDVCWNCGAESSNADNSRCLKCPEALVPPRLLLTWDTGRVRLGPGESVELGREGPHERIFRDHGNVSRKHATVGVEPDGDVWILPVDTTNGTFRLGDPEEELTPGRRHALRDGETVRFARDVPAEVAVFALRDA